MNNGDNVFSGSKSAAGGLAFSAAVLAYIALSLVFSIICSAAGLGPESDAFVYASYLLAPAAVCVSVPVVCKLKKLPFAQVIPVKMSPPASSVKWLGISVLLAFGLLFSLSWLNVAFEKFLSLFGYESEVGYFPDLGGARVLAALLVMAAVPALFEETLFRGAVLFCMREEAGDLNSVFIGGMCFALFHASPVQTFYQFACGCAFALLAIRARSVLPCMLAHFLNNAVIIVLQACGVETAGSVFDWVPVWAAVLITVLSALSLIAGTLLLVFGGQPLAKPQKGGVKYFFITAAAGIFALAVLWISGLF